MPDPETLSPEKRALLEQRLRAARAAPPPTRSPVTTRASDRAPLSPAQEELWYFSRLVPQNPIYNQAVSIRKRGPLDVRALRAALDETIHRHQIWRTTFQVIDGEPAQIVQPAPALDFPIVDLSTEPPRDREREAVRLATAQALLPYDLERGPLLRPLLIRLAEDNHRLYLCLHYLIFDGVSLYRIILPELVTLYNDFTAGREPSLPEPSIQYADYACAIRDEGFSPDHLQRVEYWREHLSGAARPQLPLDHPRPARQQFHRAVRGLRIPEELADRLRSLSQATGVTLFQVLAAAFTVLLFRFTGQEEIVFVTLTDMRDRRELEPMVGYCITPLMLRVNARGEPSFIELLSRVRGELADALSNLVPFAQLVRELPIAALYRVALVLEPQTAIFDPAWSLHQMDTDTGDAVGAAQFDLLLELDERPEGHIDERLFHDTELFEPETISRLAEYWIAVLDAVTSEPTRPISELALPMASANVGRTALPEPEPVQRSCGDGVAPPRSADERRMAGIWARLLGVEKVGVDEDFFELGGRSLLALRLLGEVAREFDVELPLDAFFESAGVTVAGLTARAQTAHERPGPTRSWCRARDRFLHQPRRRLRARRTSFHQATGSRLPLGGAGARARRRALCARRRASRSWPARCWIRFARPSPMGRTA